MLYAVVDTGACRARRLDPLRVAEAFLRGGARLVQLRAKDLPDRDVLTLAERLMVQTDVAGARLIVNDRADIARLVGAHGVHVGQDDLAVSEVRRLVGAASTVGLSTHNAAQVDAALATDASYVAVGPVFGTTTKETGYAACGLDLVSRASGRGRPIVAIGGITLENAAGVIAAGASAVAVIGDLLRDEDIEGRVRAFVERLPPVEVRF